MVSRHYPATGEQEESTAIKAPLFKKQRQKGQVKLFVESSGWRLLLDMLQAGEEPRTLAIANIRQLASSKGPKVGAYIQYSLLEHLANSLLLATDFVRSAQADLSPRAAAGNTKSASKRHGKHKHKRKQSDSADSSVREKISPSTPEASTATVDRSKQLELSNLSEIWLSLSRLEPSIRSRLVRVGVMKLFLNLLRHKDPSIKLVILECLKPFFTSNAHQTEMLKVGIVDRLIELLSTRDAFVQNKAFDVILYFDERQQPRILERGILKALIRLIKRDSKAQLKTRALEMILYFNSQDCQKELLSAGVLKELVEMSLDGGANAKAATSLVLKVLSVLRHFDVSYRDVLVAEKIMEPMIGLLKLDDEKIKLQTLSVLDDFIETHESALISAGLLSAITALVMSANTDVRMKAFDTMARLRLHTKEIVDGGLLSQLIHLMTDMDVETQLRAFKLLSSYMQQMTQSLLVDAGILHQLIRLLSLKWVSRPLIYGLVFDFLRDFDTQFQHLMIELGIIENIMDLLRMPLLQVAHKEASLNFVRWLRPPCHVEAMSRGIVSDIVSAAKLFAPLQREALATLTSLSGWMAFAAETPTILSNLFDILVSPHSSDSVKEKLLDILENFPDHQLLCSLKLPKILLDFMLPRGEGVLIVRAAKLFVSLRPVPTKDLLISLFIVAREAASDAALTVLDVFELFTFEQQRFTVDNCDAVQQLLDCAATSRPDELRVKCLDVLLSLPGYKTIMQKFSLGKSLLSLLSGKAESFQLRVIKVLKDVGVTSDLLIDDGLVPRMMRTIYAAASEEVSLACMGVLEELNEQGGPKLADHLATRKEPDVLDVYSARLNPKLCHPALEITNNLQSVSASSSSKKLWRTVICDKGIVNGAKSWEVVLDRCSGGNIMIGVCTRDHPLNTYIGQSSSYRGWSYYGGASGYTYHDGVCNPSYGTRMKQGHVVTITLDFTANTLAFSANGKFLGVAFSSGFEGLELYPAVSMYDAGDQVTLREAGTPAAKTADAPSRSVPRFLNPKTSSLLNKWIAENQQQRWVLLYKASDHGWSSQEFHSRCDARGATITIVRTAKGAEFGGYASVPWEKDRGYKADPNAFLFSVTTVDGKPTETVHGQYAHLNCAIYAQTKYGPSFGNGFDLYINLDYPSSSYAHLGHTYRPPSFDQQNIHLSGTSGSWGKHDVEVYGKFTDSVVATSVRLLNQFIRLLVVPTQSISERVANLIADSFASTHRKEVLKELHRLLGDRRQPADLKLAMKALLSRIQFPGLATIPFEAFDSFGNPVTGVKVATHEFSDVLFKLSLPEGYLPSSGTTMLPYVTHVVVASKSAGVVQAEPLRTGIEAIVFATAQEPPNITYINKYSAGLTEASLQSFWPSSPPVTPRAILTLERSEEESHSDSDVEYVDPSLDKIKFPGISAAQKSQIFGPLPPPLVTAPSGPTSLRLSDSVVTKKIDPLLPSPRAKQAAVVAARSNRPLAGSTNSIPTRITPQQLPRTLPSYMGYLPDPTSRAEADEEAAAKPVGSQSSTDVPKARTPSPPPTSTSTQVPPISLPVSVAPTQNPRAPSTRPTTPQSPSEQESVAPLPKRNQDSISTQKTSSSSSAPALTAGKSPLELVAQQRSSASAGSAEMAVVPSLKPAISALRPQNSNPFTPRNSNAGEKTEKRSPHDAVPSPRRTPRGPSTPRRDRDRDREKQGEVKDRVDKERQSSAEKLDSSSSKRPRSDERNRSKKSGSKTLNLASRDRGIIGEERPQSSSSSKVSHLRRTNSSTAVQNASIRSAGSSSSRRTSINAAQVSSRRPSSPDKGHRHSDASKPVTVVSSGRPLFFDDELHRSAGSDSEPYTAERRSSTSKRRPPISSQSFASIDSAHRRADSVDILGKRSPVRQQSRAPSSSTTTAAPKPNPTARKDLTSSDDSSDVGTPRLPPKASDAAERQSTSLSSVMYIYLNSANQKVRTKDEAHVDLSEPRRVRYRVLWIATDKVGFVDENTALDDCGYDPSTDPNAFVAHASQQEASESEEWEDSSAVTGTKSSPTQPQPAPVEKVIPMLTISPGSRPTSPLREPQSRAAAPATTDASLLSPKTHFDDSAIGASEDVDISADSVTPPTSLTVLSPQPSRAPFVSPLLAHVQALDNSTSSASKAITQSREQLAQSRASDGSDTSNVRPVGGTRTRRPHRRSQSQRQKSLANSAKSAISLTQDDSLPLSDSFEDDPMDKVRAALANRNARRARTRLFRRSGALSDSETMALSASLAGTEDFEEAEEEEPRKPPPVFSPRRLGNPNEGASSDSISSSESYEKHMRDGHKKRSKPHHHQGRNAHHHTAHEKSHSLPPALLFRVSETEDMSDDALSRSQHSPSSPGTESSVHPQVRRIVESIAGSEMAASAEESSEAFSPAAGTATERTEGSESRLPDESEISDSREHSLSSLSLSVSVAQYDKQTMRKEKEKEKEVSETSSSALEDDAEEPEEEESLRKHNNYVYADGPEQDDAGSDPEESAASTAKRPRQRVISSHSSFHQPDDTVSSFSLSLSASPSPRDHVLEAAAEGPRDLLPQSTSAPAVLTPEIQEELAVLARRPSYEPELTAPDEGSVEQTTTYAWFLLHPVCISFNQGQENAVAQELESARLEPEVSSSSVASEQVSRVDSPAMPSSLSASDLDIFSPVEAAPTIPPDVLFPLALVPIPAVGFLEHPLVKATCAQWLYLRFRKSRAESGKEDVTELDIRQFSVVAFLPWLVRPSIQIPLPMSLSGVAEGIGIIKRSLKSFFYVSDFDTNGLLHWLGTNEGRAATYKNPAITGKVLTQTSHAMFEPKMLMENIVGRSDVSTFWGGSVPQWFSLDLGRYEIFATHYTIKHGYHLANSYLQNFQFQGSKDDVNWVTLHEQVAPCFHRQFDTTTFRISDGKEYFRYFRVVQNGFYAMGSGQAGAPFMCLSGFELYGEMRSFDAI